MNMKISQLKTDKFYNGQEIQELIGETPQTTMNIGFNCALNSIDWASAKNEYPHEWDEYAAYFLQAEKLIQEGALYFKRDGLVIKVMKDGGSFCCIGEGFVNLQESDNYAFGDTFEEAISNYKQKFKK